ncbi:peptide-methionine (S)-S-oxide reductase MsrA [Flavobacterium sp.]|uniref:peptide-methionine (S)-S-oxide reductase MsrA n=1 Tax=Flavobacterium sp. TaxID=239 RepID=UPI0026181FDD|nr:peptide-methionine (S)-S-oxide reductase MsrA [Flavobacterium sp.]MDD3005042.1 peptide-methionine (S)-S-oxide reductase MsrA [Flavobacterium sp.]
MSTLNSNSNQDHIQIATLAGGCFWCTEAVFLNLEGVISVQPGYIGGTTENPTYKEISTGLTGHAEAIEIKFDTRKIDFETLLEVFFATHDPTTLNRQGADVGTQYRSEIFYHDDNQKQISENYIAQLNLENTFGKSIVTKISKASRFYVAEDYHKNYYNRNTSQSYCTYVITPKINKLKEKFQDKLKK